MKDDPTEESTTKTDIVMLFIRATGMKSDQAKTTSNFFDAADPYYEIKNESGEVVGRSMILRNDLNPAWPPLKLNLCTLCDDVKKEEQSRRKVSIVFYDYDEKNPSCSKTLACIETNLEELRQAAKAYKKQRNASFFEKKESFSLDSMGAQEPFKVFIYDVVEIVGTATPLISSDIELLRSTIAEKIDRINESESKIVEFKEQVNQQEEFVEKMKNDSLIEATKLEEATVSKNSLTENLNAAGSKIEALRSEIFEKIKLLQDIETQNCRLQDEVTKSEEKFNDLQNVIQELQNNSDTSNEATTKADNLRNMLEKELLSTKSEIDKLRMLVEEKASLLTESESKNFQYINEALYLVDKKEEQEGRAERLKQDNVTIQKQLQVSNNSNKEKLNIAKLEMDRLQEDTAKKIELLNVSESRNFELKEQISQLQDELSKQKTLAEIALSEKAATETELDRSRISNQEKLNVTQETIDQLRVALEEKTSLLAESKANNIQIKDNILRAEDGFNNQAALVESLKSEKLVTEERLDEAKASIQKKIDHVRSQMNLLCCEVATKIKLLKEAENRNTELQEKINELAKESSSHRCLVDELRSENHAQTEAFKETVEEKELTQEKLTAASSDIKLLQHAAAEQAGLLNDSKNSILQFKDQISTFGIKVKDQEALMEKLRTEKITTDNKLMEITKLKDSIANELNSARLDVEFWQSEDTTKNELLRQATAENTKLQDQNAKLIDQSNDRQALVEQHQSKILSQEVALKEAIESEKSMKEMFESTSSEMKLLQSSNSEKIELIIESKSLIGQSKEQIISLQTQIDYQNNLIDKLQAEKSTLEEIDVSKSSDVNKLKEEVVAKDKRISQVETENSLLQDQINDFTKESRFYEALVEQLQKESKFRDSILQQVVDARNSVEGKLEFFSRSSSIPYTISG